MVEAAPALAAHLLRNLRMHCLAFASTLSLSRAEAARWYKYCLKNSGGSGDCRYQAIFNACRLYRVLEPFALEITDRDIKTAAP